MSAPGPVAAAADPSPAAQRLMDAAERLVATYGVRVSLREITTAAGHRNSSAVAYHFGDRQGLMDAVWQRRTVITNRRRAQLLEQLVRDGKPDDLMGLVAAHVQPLVEVMTVQRPSYWARFNELWLADLPLDFVEAVRTDLTRFTQEVPLSVLVVLLDRLRVRVAQDHPDSAARRVALYVRFVISSLASWERDAEGGRVRHEDLPGFADEVTSMAVALLQAPGRRTFGD